MHVKLASSNFLYDFSVTKLFLWHSIFVSFWSIQHIQNSQHTQGVIDFSVVLPLPSNLQFHVQKTADYDMMWGQKALHPLSEPTPFNCDMGWLIEIFDNTLPRIEAVFFSSVACRTNVYRTIFCNLERREIYPFQIVLSLAINRYPICHSFSAGVGCREGFKLLAPTSRCIMFLSVIIL